MKHLLPTLKEKNRYIVFEVISDKTVSKDDTFNNIKEVCYGFIGKLGMAEAGLVILNFWKKQRSIIKINYKSVDKIRAALALITKVDNQRVVVRSLGVSGILNKAEKKFMEAI